MTETTATGATELLKSLQLLREELQKLLADSSAGAQPVDLDAPIGRLSRMDAMQQQSMIQANRRTAQTRLTQVEAALRRHANGEYGLCLRCEEEVGYARLKASPEVSLCITCQQEVEMRSKRQA